MFRSIQERKVKAAGYDVERLPPGQHMTEKWPVLHAGSVPRVDLATWTFRVFGEVENEVSLTWEQFNELPRSSNVQDIHCVTRWSRFDTAFEGVHWRELAKLAGPKPTAQLRRRLGRARLHLERPDRVSRGRPRPPRHPRRRRAARRPTTAIPLRLVIPHKYFWKSAKWLRGIELLSEDRLGFWERYGYNNDADPWKEERYSF